MATKSTKTTTEKAPKADETNSRFAMPQNMIKLQKRMVEGQQSAFDSTYRAINSFQEGREDAFRGYLERSRFVPVEAREIAEAWIEAGRARREAFKTAVESSFAVTEKYLDSRIEAS